MKAHIKIIRDDDLSFRKGEDRYIVVSSTSPITITMSFYFLMKCGISTLGSVI